MVCVIAGISALIYSRPTRSPMTIRVSQARERRREETKEAFRNQKPLTEEEISRELKPLFEELNASFRAQNRERMLANFDLDRIYDELLTSEMIPGRLVGDRPEFVGSLRKWLGEWLAVLGPAMEWNSYEIRHIEKLEGNEAVVIVHHNMSRNPFSKRRWWVSKRSGAWKVYDWERLDMGIRQCTRVAMIVAEGSHNRNEISNAINCLDEAFVAVVSKEDADAADAKLKEAEKAKFPASLEAARFLMIGLVRLHRGQYKEALEAWKETRRLREDMPYLDLLDAIAYNRLGEPDKALKLLERYQGLLGEDPYSLRELGEALLGLQRAPEACTAYGKALDLDAKEADAFLGLLRAVRAAGKRDDLAARFAKLDKLQENFDTFAEDCRQIRDSESLEQLARAMRQIDPRYAPADYYLALARVWAGEKNDEAISLFRSALAKQKDKEKREGYIIGFLQAMQSAGHAVKAYEAAPDRDQAFRLLAADLKSSYGWEQLQQLTAAHASKHPDDVLLPFYQGEVHVREENYALADKDFTQGMAKPPDRVVLDDFRASRVLARFHIGQALAAYAEIGPQQETFQQLALLCLQEKDHAQLQALLDAHEKAHPDDAAVMRYRYRMKISQDHVAEGIELFKKVLARQVLDKDRKEIEAEFVFEMRGAGKWLEGYQAAANARYAFELLAGDFVEEDQWDELRALVEAHRQRSAGRHQHRLVHLRATSAR